MDDSFRTAFAGRPGTTKPQRPFGVYALIIALVFLALSLAADVWRVRQGLPPEVFLPWDFDRTVIVYGVLVAFLIVLFVGLWNMWTWGWFLTMVAAGFGLFFAIWRQTNGGSPYLVMLLLIVTVFYINLTSVKAAFRQDPKREVTI